MASSGSYYACVQKILNHVNPSVLSDFSTLDTDIKRVIYVRKLDYVESTFTVQKTRNTKNLDEAKKSRENGNEFYLKQDYAKALSYYTKSVISAPASQGVSPTDDELSLALANRSATLYQMGKPEAALEDMYLALKHGYPNELRFKVYDRIGKCCQQLCQFEEAQAAFHKAIEYISASLLSENKRSNWMKSIEESIEACRNPPGDPETAYQVEEVVKKEAPQVRKPSSGRYPSASDAFDVHYEDTRGRFAMAKYPVKVGDIVLSESPFTGVLARDMYMTHCFHCFKILEAPIGCYECTLVRFCSGTCRDDAWNTYHAIECKYLHSISESGIGNFGHLGLRVILTTGLHKLLHRRSGQREAATKTLIDENDVYEGRYEALLDLVGHSSERNSSEMFQYTLLAIYSLLILKDAGFFNEKELGGRKVNVVENYVTGILLRFLQIISCNGIEVMETHYSSNVQRAEQVTLGLGLFSTVALVNHSCNPNMELIFYGNMCVTRAIRNVATGQELTIDYGYVYYLTERNQRNFSLKSQYYFDCTCEACRANWPLRSKLPAGIPTMKCTKCSYPLSLVNHNNKDPNVVKCRKCGQTLAPLSYLEEYYESSKMFDRALDEIRLGHVENPARILENHLTLMEKYLVLPVKEYVICLSALKQCYRVMGNCVKGLPSTRAKSNSFSGFSAERW